MTGGARPVHAEAAIPAEGVAVLLLACRPTRQAGLAGLLRPAAGHVNMIATRSRRDIARILTLR